MIKKVAYVLGFFLVFILLISPFFIKVKIECRSQFGECPPEVNNKLQTTNYKFLFLAKRQASKILKDSFLVSNFSMQLKLPNKLFVSTIIKKPRYSVLDKSQNKYFSVDYVGTVLSIADNTDLPFIIKDTVSEKSGDKISDKDLFALNLVEGINQMYQVRSGMIQNNALVVDMPNGVRVILPVADAEVEVLLGSVRLIYTKVTTDFSGIYSQIDLRFKNPVLR